MIPLDGIAMLCSIALCGECAYACAYARACASGCGLAEPCGVRIHVFSELVGGVMFFSSGAAMADKCAATEHTAKVSYYTSEKQSNIGNMQADATEHSDGGSGNMRTVATEPRHRIEPHPTDLIPEHRVATNGMHYTYEEFMVYWRSSNAHLVWPWLPIYRQNMEPLPWYNSDSAHAAHWRVVCSVAEPSSRSSLARSLLCSRTDGQGGRSAHGFCTALAGQHSGAFVQRTVPVGIKECLLPAMAIVPYQRSSVEMFCKLFRSSNVQLCFANGCSRLLLCSRETGLAVRDS